MLRRTKTPTGRKSPVLFAKVRANGATSYPYVVTIKGSVTGEDPFHARRAVLVAVTALCEAGKIQGAETVRVSYQRGPRRGKGTTEEVK